MTVVVVGMGIVAAVVGKLVVALVFIACACASLLHSINHEQENMTLVKYKFLQIDMDCTVW
jgi:hypothetical protein